MEVTYNNLNLIGTSTNYQGVGRCHGIGEVKYSGGEIKQEIDQLAHTFIGDMKWESLRHADNNITRKFWEDNNLIQGDTR